MNKSYDVIVVGGGLAGLTTAYELVKQNKKVLLLEKEQFLGGRTASWDDNGMLVESGLHRHIGYYKALPKLLADVGVNINDIVYWEDKLDIRLKKGKTITLGTSPFLAPLKFMGGILGNNDLLSIKDKWSIIKIFMVGFKDYLMNPEKLDRYGVRGYARKHKITNPALKYLITPLSTGIFFLPPEDYSAKVFFGLFIPSLKRFSKIRIGAYLAGMSSVLANPIKNKIEKLGGEIVLNTAVTKLILEENEVRGVEVEGNTIINASYVVLATDLNGTKKILSYINNDWANAIINIPTMSALTIQFKLNKPWMDYDRVTFAPETIMASFTEESHTTFPREKGRLSVIISNPDKYIDMDNKDIYDLIIKEAKKLDIDLEPLVLDYRIIREKDKFYHLGPNHDKLRPSQVTPIKGLVLAGDYTRQDFFSTMEGAVLSGMEAVKYIK